MPLELVELLDRVEALDVEHQGPLGGDRAAGQAGPGALGDHRPARGRGLAQHLDHVGPVAGAHHLERRRRDCAPRDASTAYPAATSGSVTVRMSATLCRSSVRAGPG